MGFRKRKQQPHSFREIAAEQRAEKDAQKERARAPVVASAPVEKSAPDPAPVEKAAPDPALAELTEKKTGAEAPA